MSQPRVRVEASLSETIAGIVVVAIVFIIVAAANINLITPMTAGLIITMTTLLVMLGHVLIARGVLSREAIFLWYMFVIGLSLMFSGAVLQGAVPAVILVPGATVVEIALTSGMFYALVVASFAAAILAWLSYTGRLQKILGSIAKRPTGGGE